MQKVFIDTDVALDLLAARDPHYTFAAQLFTLADEKKIAVYISSLSFSNLSYILRSSHSTSAVKKILIDFKELLRVLAVDDNIINQALASAFTDIEDAIQHFTAVNHGIPLILTRNVRDYKKSAIPVSTPEQFLKVLE